MHLRVGSIPKFPEIQQALHGDVDSARPDFGAPRPFSNAPPIGFYDVNCLEDYRNMGDSP